jgi:hypothetical protein
VPVTGAFIVVQILGGSVVAGTHQKVSFPPSKETYVSVVEPGIVNDLGQTPGFALVAADVENGFSKGVDVTQAVPRTSYEESSVIAFCYGWPSLIAKGAAFQAGYDFVFHKNSFT